MIQLLTDERGLTKNSDGYKWRVLLESQLAEEEYIKQKEFLENRVRLLAAEIEESNLAKFLKEKKEKLILEKEIKEEALKNFDSYWEEELKKQEEKKQEEKETLTLFVERFDEVVDLLLEKEGKQQVAKLDNLKIQLEDAQTNLQVYLDVKKEE